MQAFLTNLQNIVNLFTHAKNIHAVFNSNVFLILLIILTWMIYVICSEVIIFKAKKSTLGITLLICLVIMIGYVFILDPSAINRMDQSHSTGILQFILLFNWLIISIALIGFTANNSKCVWALITFVTVSMSLAVTLMLFTISAMRFPRIEINSNNYGVCEKRHKVSTNPINK